MYTNILQVYLITSILHNLSVIGKYPKVTKYHFDFTDTCEGTSQNLNLAPKMSDQVTKAAEGAVWGMLIADALSMPVHWYYNPDDIKRGYGSWLTGYVAPNKRHPSSILSLSAVDGSGRTGWHSKSKPIIGSVILHDKLKYWQGDRSTHYHQGMRAGDNTLNSVTAIQMMKTLQRVDPKVTEPSRGVRGQVLEDYVKFMTTPGSHNDTYAESFHRSFFKDWASEHKKHTTAEELLQFTDKRYSEKAKGPGDSQLVVIGAMAPALPWIIRNAHRSEDDCAREAIDFVKCTHPVPAIVPFVDLYARLLHGVINGRDLKQEAVRALSHSELGGPQKREMVLALIERAGSYPKGSEERLKAYQRATQTLGSACYIEGAMSSMLFLAYEFADDFQAGVLNNANCGGENCHRGAALGALLGANAINKGKDIPQTLKDGLQAKKTVNTLLQEMKESRMT
ncbi:uncharacterized protein LOC128558605 isoform X1 [Mercenaria mercenaria]|uniref:uncharacterized protein LOC128558605 isoform X1 n=1 Tax=Mercenaria mercenaria TaxID=6596 RepID=UPI00234F0D4D|nr:uncharacterized protein LOC128558605 isoform X1 [Mercenaria mercenaria]